MRLKRSVRSATESGKASPKTPGWKSATSDMFAEPLATPASIKGTKRVTRRTSVFAVSQTSKNLTASSPKRVITGSQRRQTRASAAVVPAPKMRVKRDSMYVNSKKTSRTASQESTDVKQLPSKRQRQSASLGKKNQKSPSPSKQQSKSGIPTRKARTERSTRRSRSQSFSPTTKRSRSQSFSPKPVTKNTSPKKSKSDSYIATPTTRQPRRSPPKKSPSPAKKSVSRQRRSSPKKSPPKKSSPKRTKIVRKATSPVKELPTGEIKMPARKATPSPKRPRKSVKKLMNQNVSVDEDVSFNFKTPPATKYEKVSKSVPVLRRSVSSQSVQAPDTHDSSLQVSFSTPTSTPPAEKKKSRKTPKAVKHSVKKVLVIQKTPGSSSRSLMSAKKSVDESTVRVIEKIQVFTPPRQTPQKAVRILGKTTPSAHPIRRVQTPGRGVQTSTPVGNDVLERKRKPITTPLLSEIKPQKQARRVDLEGSPTPEVSIVNDTLNKSKLETSWWSWCTIL